MFSLHGVDIYIKSDAVPEVPETIASLKRSFISDRGTRVQNTATHDTSRSDIYCVRYESETSIDDAVVNSVISEIEAKGFSWPKIQKLFRYENGDKAYSQPY
jgi:hypothetical protein